ncbi:MAG: winged helix-turn-helix domain-containing protein, partial [Alphaproteobacteria bacterium]|nr:winged helix-turn-helix domain-containing protein [Alphaproteobacteria bacterium]
MDTLTTADVFLFAEFRLDRSGLARRDQSGTFVPVSIGSRALEILAVLVARSGDLVTRDEITRKVWPGAIVEYSDLPVQIASLRRVLDHERTSGSLIQTVPGRGYRFAVAVSRAPPVAVPSLPEKPSIAVLPFANISGDPEQEYFADGMVEEIITALSRIRWLFVIARNSTFTYKGQSTDVQQVGHELGVRYVLEGSVRRAGGRVRITAQLIDAQERTHLWADRFEGSLEDVFELQDRVASSVAGVIEPALQAAETARSADRPTSDLTAYDLYLRAYAMFFLSAQQIPEALRLLERAIERDPNYGPALALAAVCCHRMCIDGSSADPEMQRRKGVDFGRRALQVANDDPGTLANAALALSYFGEEIGAMIAVVERALVLNPSFARGWYIRGILGNMAGQFDAAFQCAEASLRLSPRGRFGQVYNVSGAALFFSRRFDEALPMLLISTGDDPSFPQAHRYLAACYAHMGRLDEAREVAARLRTMTPVVVGGATPYRNPDDREFLLSGLRLAAG